MATDWTSRLDVLKGDVPDSAKKDAAFFGNNMMPAFENKQNAFETRVDERFDLFRRPEVQRLGALGERDALSAFQREKAQALQQLGYNRSAGSGGSGGYDAANIALERGSQAQLGSIKRSAEMYETGAYLKYLDKEDDQRHQLNAMRQQYEYQMKIAEQNSASWWEGLTGIAGMALAIWQPWAAPVTAAGMQA